MLLKEEKSKKYQNNLVIVLEGLPCSGKTTLAKRLTKYLNIKLAGESLFLINRRDKRRINFYLNDLLKNSESRKETTVIDRYFLSTLAFEEVFRKVYGKKMKKITADISLYDPQNFCASKLYSVFLRRGILKRPDLVFYLKISPAESLKRRIARGKINHKNNPWSDIKFLTAFQNYCIKNGQFWYKSKPIIINGNLTMKEIASIIKRRIIIN